MKVWVVNFVSSEGSVSTLCVCASRMRAECMADCFVFDEGYDAKSIRVQELEVIL